jgi:hypothetical protein
MTLQLMIELYHQPLRSSTNGRNHGLNQIFYLLRSKAPKVSFVYRRTLNSVLEGLGWIRNSSSTFSIS